MASSRVSGHIFVALLPYPRLVPRQQIVFSQLNFTGICTLHINSYLRSDTDNINVVNMVIEP